MPKTGLDVTNERLDAELAAKLDERRRVTIGQMADFDFPDLCRKVAESISQTRVDRDQECEICHCDLTWSPFCLACLAVATKVIAETAAKLGAKFFRENRLGRLTTGTDYL